jgi:SnoaL-like domain
MTASKVLEAFFRAVEEKQLDRAFGLLADDLVVEGPAPVPLGKREYTAVHAAWARACSDWRFNCSKIDAIDDRTVIATIGITATFDGELAGLPVPGLPARVAPTGRKAKLPEERPQVTVENGKITALRFTTPPGGGVPGLLAQFGIAPAPNAAVHA